jgi:hypothetical protein
MCSYWKQDVVLILVPSQTNEISCVIQIMVVMGCMDDCMLLHLSVLCCFEYECLLYSYVFQISELIKEMNYSLFKHNVNVISHPTSWSTYLKSWKCASGEISPLVWVEYANNRLHHALLGT